jgi:LAO/AO transport system kinase
MVDCFALLLAPGGGDELQGIKRGNVELADLLLINEADGDLLAAAERARADYQAALHLLRPASRVWTPEVLSCSALHEKGIEAVWQAVLRQRRALEEAGELATRRARQAHRWLWAEIEAGLTEALRADPAGRRLIGELEDQVREARLLPSAAARRLVRRFLAAAEAQRESGDNRCGP